MSLPLRYSREFLRRDIIAALTVAAISLPQGMAYALLASVDPRYGLFSAILVTFVASVFGSSSHLINGPTSAISLVVFSSLSMFDADQRIEAAEAMFLLGALVGTVQILIATFRLGDLTRYISESVILGFMFAAALLLAVGQISNALGVRDKGTGAQHILTRLWLTLTQGDAVNAKAVAVSASTLILALVARRLVRRFGWPQFDMFSVLMLVSLVAYGIGWTVPGADGKTAIAVTGVVPAALPSFHIPVVNPMLFLVLAPDSLAIAGLGLLEALAIAKSIAHQTRQPLDYNRQCLAEGLANLAGGFFQCLPGSGSLSRSAINFQAGAATRVSGLFTALLVAAVVLVAAPLSRYAPKAALAALLLLTAARLIDVKRLLHTLQVSGMDAGVVIATAASAIAFGLDDAILIGVALSFMLFIPRAARLKSAELFVDPKDVVRERLPSDPAPTGYRIYDLQGELFFGAAPELERLFADIEQTARTERLGHALIRVKRVRNPDVVGLERFEQFLKESEAKGLKVWLAGVQPDLAAGFARLHLPKWFDERRVFRQGQDEDSATLAAIRQIRARLPSENAPSPELYYQV
jgi:SulP family sulfate permease